MEALRRSDACYLSARAVGVITLLPMRLSRFPSTLQLLDYRRDTPPGCGPRCVALPLKNPGAQRRIPARTSAHLLYYQPGGLADWGLITDRGCGSGSSTGAAARRMLVILVHLPWCPLQ